jgi:alkaline phosphatase D
MKTTRREFAAMASAFGAALAFGKGVALAAAWQERRDLYPQGVASGDPQADSVILWTRHAPMADHAVHRLGVEVSSTPQFTDVVARGMANISAESDWTCRFLAAGLKPSREYWYRFTDEQGFGSRIGRTVTAPTEDDERPVRFAFVSCQDVTQGACNAYRRMMFEDQRRPVNERLAFVLHLGDFFYELVWYPEDSPGGVNRGRRLRDIVRYPSGEKITDFHVPTTLEDYRTAYRGYLTDPDLQDARAYFPFVCVWDNHEFSWQGFQSQQVFNGEIRPAQTKKIAANQAWFEFQPARVVKASGPSLDTFDAPHVVDAALTQFDDGGVGTEPNNLTALHSLRVYRALKFGKNTELIITDNRSFMSPPQTTGGEFAVKGFPFVGPQDASEITDGGRAYNNGRPPATIKFDGKDMPNPAINEPPQRYLGREQKAWLFDRLKSSKAPWKVWGHSFGTLSVRMDMQNLPAIPGRVWPSQSYGLMNGGYVVEHDEIWDFVRDNGITGLALVAGDKHSFWAGRPSKTLPPEKFEPVAVEFITGSISAQGLFEVAEIAMKKDHPLRALYLWDKPDGTVGCTMNMTVLHGVKSSLELAKTGDKKRALALSNPEVAPHLSFADWGGHGYGVVRVTRDDLETEFVCINRPLERNTAPDGGPLVYRVVHRVRQWQPGQPPQLEQRVLEGDPRLAI